MLNQLYAEDINQLPGVASAQRTVAEIVASRVELGPEAALSQAVPCRNALLRSRPLRSAPGFPSDPRFPPAQGPVPARGRAAGAVWRCRGCRWSLCALGLRSWISPVSTTSAVSMPCRGHGVAAPRLSGSGCLSRGRGRGRAALAGGVRSPCRGRAGVKLCALPCGGAAFLWRFGLQRFCPAAAVHSTERLCSSLRPARCN